MSIPVKAIPIYTNKGKHLTPQEASFISSYMICFNASQAVVEAGYRNKRY